MADEVVAKYARAEDDPEFWAKLRDPKFRESFEKKYKKNKSGCWIWTASRDKDDYGQVRVGKYVLRAHRVSYELYTDAPIPEGMDIDHTCHIRRCVNIDHHDPVEHKENMQNLRKTEDWEISEEEFHQKKTTPEQILEEAVAILERSQVFELVKADASGYPVLSDDAGMWRKIQLERGFLPQDKISAVKMYLDAVELGADWKIAADRLLGVSPMTVANWQQRNLLFREDILAAKRAGRRNRYHTLEDMHLDEMERKIGFADFRDITDSLKKIREMDEERIAVKKQQESGSMPNITIVFGDNPRRALETLIDIGDAIEAEYEVKDS